MQYLKSVLKYVSDLYNKFAKNLMVDKNKDWKRFLTSVIIIKI